MAERKKSTSTPTHVVQSVAGCEAGNEIDDAQSVAIVATKKEAEVAFANMVSNCQKHVSNQSQSINDGNEPLSWTSPYYWHVVWIRMPTEASALPSKERPTLGEVVGWVDETLEGEVDAHVARTANGGANEDGAYVDDDIHVAWDMFLAQKAAVVASNSVECSGPILDCKKQDVWVVDDHFVCEAGVGGVQYGIVTELDMTQYNVTERYSQDEFDAMLEEFF